MKTVQLALENVEYAQSLRDLLLRDGNHRVYLVEQPDLRLDGIVMVDGDRYCNLDTSDSQPERFVVMAHKGSDSLSRIWDAGVRHVLFDGDPPNTAQLAIIAAELRLPAVSKTLQGIRQPGIPIDSSAPTRRQTNSRQFGGL